MSVVAAEDAAEREAIIAESKVPRGDVGSLGMKYGGSP